MIDPVIPGRLDRSGTGHGLQLVLDVPPIVDETPHAGSSVVQTTFNLVNIFMGIGEALWKWNKSVTDVRNHHAAEC